MQGSGATPHLHRPGQGAFLLATARDATLHHMPDIEQAAANLFLGAPHFFVLHHQLADRDFIGFTQPQQIRAAMKRIRLIRAVRYQAVLGSRVFIDDKTATDRVIHFADQLGLIRIVGGKTHAVGVIRQDAPPVKQQMILFNETDFSLSQQLDTAAAADLGKLGLYRVYLDQIGSFTH
ncbi:hypothetical protein D3C81_1071670 [compost metagenome]